MQPHVLQKVQTQLSRSEEAVAILKVQTVETERQQN